MLPPSDDRPELAQLAVSPTGRAAHVYLLPGEGERAEHGEVRRRLAGDRRRRPGLLAGAERRRARAGASERGVAERACASGPGDAGQRPARRRAGTSTATRRCWRRRSRTAGCAATSTRTRSPASSPALSAPHAGDFVVSLAPGYEAVDWGGVTHAGGGSHGSLHAGDSLGPLLFVGCGPGDAGEREQWTLRDVAPVVLEHFGLE